MEGWARSNTSHQYFRPELPRIASKTVHYLRNAVSYLHQLVPTHSWACHHPFCSGIFFWALSSEEKTGWCHDGHVWFLISTGNPLIKFLLKYLNSQGCWTGKGGSNRGPNPQSSLEESHLSLEWRTPKPWLVLVIEARGDTMVCPAVVPYLYSRYPHLGRYDGENKETWFIKRVMRWQTRGTRFSWGIAAKSVL